MLIHDRIRYSFELSSQQVFRVQASLAAKNWKGALYEAERAISKVFDLPEKTPIRGPSIAEMYYGIEANFSGDVYYRDGCVFYFRVSVENDLITRRARRDRVEGGVTEVGLIRKALPETKKVSLEEFATEFEAVIEPLLKEKHIKPKRIAVDYDRDPRVAFKRLQVGREPKVEVAHIAEAELSLSAMLCNKKLLEVLRLISKSRRVRGADFAKSISEAGLDDSLVEGLVNNGMLSKSFIVECRQTSAQLVSLGSDYEEEMRGNVGRLRCPACGKQLNEERVGFVIDLGDAGSKLITKSQWLTVWVTSKLVDLGIGLEEILWNIEDGADEVDILTIFRGQVWIFELKDREFGAGDAHRFSYRSGRYAATKSFIVTTEQVSLDAKEVFKETMRQSRERRGSEFESGEPIYVEGLSHLEKVLAQEAEKTSLGLVKDELRNLGLQHGYDIAGVLDRIFKGERRIAGA